MQKIDWSTYKFHPSAISNLMVRSRKVGEVSETTKSFLHELYINEVWGRIRPESIANKYMQKGTMVETDSISLYERVSGLTLFKNNKQLENDYLIGTPDIIKPVIIDIKSSWDLFTFAKVDEKSALKSYYWQLLAYMSLRGVSHSKLVYCLVDTPDIITNDEMYRLSFKLPEEQLDAYKNNYVFTDIPEEMRVKEYDIEYSQEDVEKMIEAITNSRIYLDSISL